MEAIKSALVNILLSVLSAWKLIIAFGLLVLAGWAGWVPHTLVTDTILPVVLAWLHRSPGDALRNPEQIPGCTVSKVGAVLLLCFSLGLSGCGNMTTAQKQTAVTDAFKVGVPAIAAILAEAFAGPNGHSAELEVGRWMPVFGAAGDAALSLVASGQVKPPATPTPSVATFTSSTARGLLGGIGEDPPCDATCVKARAGAYLLKLKVQGPPASLAPPPSAPVGCLVNFHHGQQSQRLHVSALPFCTYERGCD